MKKIFITLFIFCAGNCFGQNPLVKMWDKRFGGTSVDELTCIQQTSDGGYILGGISASGIGGDKTQATWGSYDYWIVKIDSNGIKQWDRDFGGTNEDKLYSLQQTIDGGYILGGYSVSGIGGNKTQATWGSYDYWIVKIDSLGNIQWDKDFGGINGDFLYCIKQTSDKGYLLGGYSWSDISGDKTKSNWDSTGNSADYWIVKTDSLGNKEWDNVFGGTSNDYLKCLKQTSDGGYILGGYSNSVISGDKNQTTWGSIDYWIVKTDSFGNKEWDKDFGGIDLDALFTLQQTLDGGYIIGGVSSSNISGDKTQATWGNWDLWILKTDSLGNKQWDKDFGGTEHEDELGNISQTLDGGYLIAGTSYSPVSGNKTELNLGDEQTWVIKIDSLGNKRWDKTLHTNSGSLHDEIGFAIQTKDGCYSMANYNFSGVGGDKTQANQGSFDYWLIKFCETLQAGFTTSPTLCPGTCTDFLNLSFNATSYQWNFPGATPDTSTAINPTSICYYNSGSYDVQLIATNANGSDTLLLSNYITVYPSPSPQAIAQSGDTLFANAGATSYQWYYNTTLITGATDYFYVASASGDYNVVATDANGCEVEAAIFNVVASAQFEISGLRFDVYPNPVEEKLIVSSSEFGDKEVSIKVYDIIGVGVCLRTPNSKLPTELDVRGLSKGMYYLEVTSGSKVFRSKFVKQ